MLAGTSCQKFDNYEEPQETLKGTIIDKGTGTYTPLTETGKSRKRYIGSYYFYSQSKKK